MIFVQRIFKILFEMSLNFETLFNLQRFNDLLDFVFLNIYFRFFDENAIIERLQINKNLFLLCLKKMMM